MSSFRDQSDGIVDQLSELARRRGLLIAAAESLTCGALAAAIGRGAAASEWLAGSVVAYRESVKFEVLGVRPGPVVTAECALQMAAGAARLLAADVAVGVSGVGGPGSEEGKPSGTVFVAIWHHQACQVSEHRFDGPPEAVIEQTVLEALRQLVEVLTSGPPERLLLPADPDDLAAPLHGRDL